jgi:hypothetical protein
LKKIITVEWLENHLAEYYVNSDEWDNDVSVNENIEGDLSWSKMTLNEMELIFQLLNFGIRSKSGKFYKDSEHFLGCIALHPMTPSSILKKLGNMKIPLVNQILLTRKK